MKFVQEISVFNPHIMYDTVTDLETSISTTAEGIRTDVRAIYASKAELSSTFAQSAHTISMGVTGKASKESGASITITLKDGNGDVISEGSGDILIDGNVVFTDQLSTAGQTTINGSNITGGTITLGGNNNGNGWLKIVNASNTEVGRWTKDGITVTTGTIKLGGKTSLTDENTGLFISSSGIALGASSVFKVTNAGVLTASSATITGTVNANSGKIGSSTTAANRWTIGGDDSHAYIYSGSKSTYASTAAGIYIGTEGINFGNAVFRVSSAGALTAKSGTIGGWTIDGNQLKSGSGTGFVTLYGNTSNTYAMWAGNETSTSAPFSVTKAGKLTSTSAAIGGFTIDANSIRAGEKTATANGSITLSTTNFTRTIGGTSRANLRFAIGANFGIGQGGGIYASSANITGAINATSGTIGASGSAAANIWHIGGTTTSPARAYIYSGSKSTFSSRSTAGTYIGTDGISMRGTTSGTNNFLELKDGIVKTTCVTIYDGGGSNSANILLDDTHQVSIPYGLVTGTANDKRINYFENGTYCKGDLVLAGELECAANKTTDVTSEDNEGGGKMRFRGSGSGGLDYVRFECPVQNSGGSTEFTSDKRLKEEIEDLDKTKIRDFIMKIKPSSFVFKSDDKKRLHHGVIAQDLLDIVEDRNPYVNTFEDDEKPFPVYTVAYMEFVADIIATIQLQQEEINALKGRIANG